MSLRNVARKLLFRLLGSHENDVGKSRWRRAITSAIAAFASRGVSIAVGLISVPLTLHYLGPERYGVLMTITSGIVLMTFADLGLGNGVVNAVSHADGTNDRRKAQEAVSSAFFSLSGIAVLVLIAFSLTPHRVWTWLFNIKSDLSTADIQSTVAVVVVSFAISLPFGVAQRVQIGYQEGYNNNLWQMFGNVVSLLGLLTAVHFRASLPWIVLSIAGAPAGVLLCNFIFQFGWKRRWLRPRIAFLNWSTSKELVHAGAAFCGLTVFSLLGTSSDNIIIAQTVGSVEVAKYSVVQKLFSLTLLIQFLTGPLWPAFSEAYARGDGHWIKSAFHRATALAASAAGLICLTFLVAGRDIIRLWAGSPVVPPFLLLAGFAVWRFTAGISDTADSLLNIGPLVTTHVKIAGVAAVVAFCAKLLAARRYGANGVAWATAISYCVLYTVPTILAAERWIRGLERRQDANDSSQMCRQDA